MADVLDIENQDEFEEFGVDEDGDRKSIFLLLFHILEIFSFFFLRGWNLNDDWA